MISFVSTFPPILCGIGTYTRYLTSHMPPDRWNVISFRLDELSRCEDRLQGKDPQVDFFISLEHPSLPPLLRGDLLWFQHSFGMWGRVNTHFIKLIGEAKERGKKVAASFHTIHFQSPETHWGMDRKEWELLVEALPLLDLVTVFTLGAYRAVVDAFPQYREKVIVLRHGVHRYPKVAKEEARQRLLNYLVDHSHIPKRQKAELKGISASLFSKETVLLGNYGFITRDKDPLRLYEVGRLVQERLPGHRVVTIFAGKIQERKDRNREASLPVLESLRAVHDGKQNLFFEDYIPESILPFAFRALDFAVFWCHNATQSGRMAHAQGTGVTVVGRKWEGVGETLELAGLPALETADELAQVIAEIVREPALAEQMEKSNARYADRYSFARQAEKHLLYEEALEAGMRIAAPVPRRMDDFRAGEIGPGRSRRPGESRPGGRIHT
ncbi:MAG: hypothetical protein JRH07_13290 [Deltaproteobacteria bacterium]|nr:hypothetical protein [Deltaproteobacteria bacterium]MBW2122799.1 hypothetical protein [Deltaproteobacteria bacterium]